MLWQTTYDTDNGGKEFSEKAENKCYMYLTFKCKALRGGKKAGGVRMGRKKHVHHYTTHIPHAPRVNSQVLHYECQYQCR